MKRQQRGLCFEKSPIIEGQRGHEGWRDGVGGGGALVRTQVGPIGGQQQQAPINHLCLHFPLRNNNHAAKFAVTGHYLIMILADEEAIRTR